MSRQTVNEKDSIRLSAKTYLDVQYCYSIPTNCEIEFNDCIATSFYSNDKFQRIYKSVGFFKSLDRDMLNSLEGDFVYLSFDFDKAYSQSLIQKIKAEHSIEDMSKKL